MNIAAILLVFPEGLAVVLLIIIFVAAGLVFYALRNKGDVRAEFSHGSTRFRLEAKDRLARKNRRSLAD